jgi:hypothetical protein
LTSVNTKSKLLSQASKLVDVFVGRFAMDELDLAGCCTDDCCEVAGCC